MRMALTTLGIGLLAVWSAWWLDAVRENRLAGQEISWLPISTVRGGDFYCNYFAGRAVVQGRDPYVDPKVVTDHPYHLTINAYPPPCVWQFVWCRGFNLHRAKTIWLLASDRHDLHGRGVRLFASPP